MHLRLSTVVALALLAGCAPAPKPFAGLPFIENEWEIARTKAEQAAVPLFVELWAPW